MYRNTNGDCLDVKQGAATAGAELTTAPCEWNYLALSPDTGGPTNPKQRFRLDDFCGPNYIADINGQDIEVPTEPGSQPSPRLEGIPAGRANLIDMTEHEASRTLVKSPPELWAECSDAGSLGRHLDPFGEIRITRLEPETAVAWEGARASGTVRLEPSGWGTRVTITARSAGAGSESGSEPDLSLPAGPYVAAPSVVDDSVAGPVAADPPAGGPAASDPPPVPAPVVEARPGSAGPERSAVRRTGFFARLFARRNNQPVSVVSAPEARDPQGALPAGPGREPPVAIDAVPESAAAAGPVPESAAAADPVPESAAVVDPVPDPDPDPDHDSRAATGPDPATVLAAALDSLGQAHHRPYSRA